MISKPSSPKRRGGAVDSGTAFVGWSNFPIYETTGVVNSSTETIDFQNRTASTDWLVGFTEKLTSVRSNGVSGQSGVLTNSREATFTPYMTTMEVGSSTAFQGSLDSELSRTYTYDGFGNQTGISLSGSHLVTRSSSAGAFQYNKYPTVLTNALGHVTNVVSYDSRYGVATEVEDPNGLVTQVAYNEFGQPISVTDSDGVVTTLSYESCDLIVCDSVGVITPAFKITSSSPVSPTVVTYYDNRSRVIRRKTEAFNGSSVDVEDYYYDSLGRIDRWTEPYREGDTFYVTARQYDIRDRLTQETRAVGGVLTAEYHAAAKGLEVRVSELTVKA